MPPRIHRDRTRRDDERETAVAPPPAPAALIMRLQQGAGNAAVAGYLAREGATETASAIEEWRELLDDGDEEGAIAKAAQLSSDDAATALADQSLRALAVSTFDDEEMARAMTSLRGGTLIQKLNWMSVEGSSLALVWPLISDPDTPASEKTALYDRTYMRDFFVDMCSNEEMQSVVGVLGGTLEQKLNWMLVEGASWAVVRPLLAAAETPAEQKTALYGKTYMKDLFVELLDNEEMADAVGLLGGTVTQKLEWMIAEGTSGELVFGVIGLAPESELYLTTPLPGWLDEGLESELSGGDYERARRMLTTGLLNLENEVDASFTETHYELKDPNDPTQGYSLQDFGIDAEYDIVYTRSELRIQVKIAFTGEVPTPAHLAIWETGITSKWNSKYHVENGRSIPIVFEPIWNSTDEHHEIELHLPPVEREDAGNWYAGPNADPSPGTQDTTDGDTAAHEFGHLCGLADEYNLTAEEYERVTGSAPTGPMPASGYDAPGVMGDHTQAAEGRHFAPFVAWLNANRIPGERPYRLVAGS